MNPLRRKTDGLGELVESPTRWWILQLWCDESISDLTGDSHEESQWCTDIKVLPGRTMDEAIKAGLVDLPPAEEFARDAVDVNFFEGNKYWYTVRPLDKDYLIQCVEEQMGLHVIGSSQPGLREHLESLFK